MSRIDRGVIHKVSVVIHRSRGKESVFCICDHMTHRIRNQVSNKKWEQIKNRFIARHQLPDFTPSNAHKSTKS